MACQWKRLSSEEPLFISKESVGSSTATGQSDDSVLELLSVPDDNWNGSNIKLTTSSRSYSLTDLGRYERYYEHLRKQFIKRGHSFTWEDFIVCFDLFEHDDRQFKKSSKEKHPTKFFDIPDLTEGDCRTPKWTSGSDLTIVTPLQRSIEDFIKDEDGGPDCSKASPKFKELVKFWSDVEDRSPEKAIIPRREKSPLNKVSSHFYLRKPYSAV